MKPARTCWRKGLYLRLFIPLGAAAIMVLAVYGCAERNFASLRPGLEKRGHYIESVTFFRQGEGSCGPAAIASVLSFWGRQADLEKITQQIYLPKLRGTLPMDMERFLRENGFETDSSSGSLDTLKERVSDNIPVICLVDRGFGFYRRPHYLTVIGFDDVNKIIIAHDGLAPDKLIGYEEFLHEWDRGGYWMLVAVPRAEHKEPRGLGHQGIYHE